MFCEKCGNKLSDNAKFCEKCGNPVNSQPTPTQQPVAQTVEQTPVEPVQTPVQPVQTPVQPVGYQSASQQVNQTIPTPVQPVQTQPVKEKKPMSKGAKMAIIFSSIGAAVVAVVLIVLFTVIFPSMNKVDPSKFIKVDFNKESLYDGYLSADFSIDSDKIFNEFLSDKKSNSEFSYLDGDSIKYSILSYCDISVEAKGNKDAKKDENSYSTTTQNLSNLKSGDTVIVKLKWSKAEDDLSSLNASEKMMGINFDKTDKTVEVKISDELKKDALTVKEPVTVDLFKYIDDNKLVYTKGIEDGELSMAINPYEFEQDGYKFSIENQSYSTYLKINDTNEGKDYSFSLSFANEDYSNYNLDNGEKVTLTVNLGYLTDENVLRVEKSGLFFKEKSKDYVTKVNTPITKSEAKSNISDLKDAIYEANDGKKLSIKSMYLLDSRDSDSSYNNIVLAVFKDGGKYYTYRITNVYINNDKVYYSNYSKDYFGYSKEKELLKYNYYLNDDDYKSTKIA